MIQSPPLAHDLTTPTPSIELILVYSSSLNFDHTQIFQANLFFILEAVQLCFLLPSRDRQNEMKPNVRIDVFS
jgi:hypothetical protein